MKRQLSVSEIYFGIYSVKEQLSHINTKATKRQGFLPMAILDLQSGDNNGIMNSMLKNL